MIKFNTVKIHNFYSYGDAEIDLRDKGFCLVSGKNNFEKDNAASNGSGKSAWINAMCACLIGETLTGQRSGFKNLFLEENSCWVTVDMNFFEDNFIITRIFNPKSDLKIIKNGEDISGKTLRDSEAILAEQLPDINRDLLGSSILIGQGFPDRLSALTPAKRKEKLENLTKTDFMVKEIREKIENRLNVLDTDLRNTEDKILVKNTLIQTNRTTLNTITTELETLQTNSNFDAEIKNLESEIESNRTLYDDKSKELTEFNNELSAVNTKYLKLTSDKSEQLQSMFEAFNTKFNSVNAEKIALNSEKSNLQHQIQHIKSIVDVCPTCHQKLAGVTKPDTKEQEARIVEIDKQINVIDQELNKLKETKAKYELEIKNTFDKDISDLDKKKADLNTKISLYNGNLSKLNTQILNLNNKLSSIQTNKANYLSRLNDLNSKKEETEKILLKLDLEVQELNTSKQEILEHTQVVKKMESLIKRDFRGILLQNVIKYINSKSKTFSQTVFGTQEIEIVLNGNNLDISYCNKPIESLSGGERTRVDLIIQLTLRDLLKNYLNLNSNILALDEITDFLDEKSCNAVMNLIENELNSTESVFIISHMANQLSLPIDSEIRVEKSAEGISSIIY